jgi:DNA helicase MCM8
MEAGLLLGLFGGRQRYLTDSANDVSIRGDSHILVVGDPGLGKSQMLSAVANVAPRGVFVCSNTATARGLTVTLTKESGSGEFALEAGTIYPHYARLSKALWFWAIKDAAALTNLIK